MKPRQMLLLSALCVLGVVNCSASLSYASFNELRRQPLLEFCSVSSSEFGVRVPCLQERLLDAPMAPVAPASIIEAHAHITSASTSTHIEFETRRPDSLGGSLMGRHSQSAPPKGVFTLQKMHNTAECRTRFLQEPICSNSAGSR